ncbi:MAG: prephenate dehydrogenase/arogenate dehydrogenase family protein [Anaerolineae bacterium]|nr:prephenate dehydrogenase/arogenate dehydrogenase family protein [Anaerolineae bacterium]
MTLLSQSSVAIIGLGLMGGSLALGLRGKCSQIIGIDPDPETCQLARARQIADRVSSDPARASEADLIVLAAPVREILTLIEQLPRLHPGSPVVLDLGSTKVDICRALDALPARFDPVGGHPMCGKETSGIANADPAIYQNAAFALTPHTRTGERARTLAGEVAAALGAIPLGWMPLSTTIGSPQLATCPTCFPPPSRLPPPEETAPADSARGFRSTARLAGSNPNMMSDVLMTNRTPIVQALTRFRTALDQLEAQLADNDPALISTLAEAQTKRDTLERVKSTL